MIDTIRLSRKLLFFQRVPAHIILATAFTSALLGGGMYLLTQPLYLIALYALLPWLPIVLFEGIWKLKHYPWLAIFAAFALLQIGHVMEHVVQVGALLVTDATLSCPPPVDHPANAERAIEAGLRDGSSAPTNRSAARIVAPGGDGLPLTRADGSLVTGPPACGIFGQLDLEIVHLVWELTGWLLSLVLVWRFPGSRWMWLSIAWASVHTVEHLFISYTFFLDPTLVYDGTRQIWGTVANGNFVTAHPLGREAAVLNFYDVSGKFGVAARNGLLGSLFPALNPYLPTRPFLHLYYNLLVTVPSLIAFVMEIRKVNDRYLRRALPQLSTIERAHVTAQVRYERHPAGTRLVNAGEAADSFYVIAGGRVEVLDTHNLSLDQLDEGDYFGEIGLMYDGVRSASIVSTTPVELIVIDRRVFAEMMAESPGAGQSIEQLARRRLAGEIT